MKRQRNAGPATAHPAPLPRIPACGLHPGYRLRDTENKSGACAPFTARLTD